MNDMSLLISLSPGKTNEKKAHVSSSMAKMASVGQIDIGRKSVKNDNDVFRSRRKSMKINAAACVSKMKIIIMIIM